MRKVIFLDIDGVLNTKYWYSQMDRNTTKDQYGYAFDPISVANLAKIIEGTGAEIVISSSWKCMGLAVLKKMWEDRKMPGKIIDVTPNAITDEIYHGLTMNDYWAWRGLEIKEWLLRHPEKVSNYVIIDDNGGMLGEQEDYIVQTDPSVGITEWDAKKAINILTNEGNS